MTSRGTTIYEAADSSSSSSSGHSRRRRGHGSSSNSSSSGEFYDKTNAIARRERAIENGRFCSGCEWWVWLVTTGMMLLVTGIVIACAFGTPLAITVVDMGGAIHKPRSMIRHEMWEAERHLIDNELELAESDELIARSSAAKKRATAAATTPVAVSFGAHVSQRAPDMCSTFFPGDCVGKWSKAELAHYAQLPRGIPLESSFRGHTCAATCQVRANSVYGNEDMSASYWQGVCICTKSPMIG